MPTKLDQFMQVLDTAKEANKKATKRLLDSLTSHLWREVYFSEAVVAAEIAGHLGSFHLNVAIDKMTDAELQMVFAQKGQEYRDRANTVFAVYTKAEEAKIMYQVFSTLAYKFENLSR